MKQFLRESARGLTSALVELHTSSFPTLPSIPSELVVTVDPEVTGNGISV